MTAVGFHAFEDIRFNDIYDKRIYQIHCNPDSAKHYIEALGLKVLCVSRHPFDVLLSAVHFIPREPQTMYWLDGAIVKNHSNFTDMSPASEEFLEWASSEAADTLLDVTIKWWEEDIIKIAYEDLICHPVETINGVLDSLGFLKEQDTAAKVEKVINFGLKKHKNKHFWKGKADNWRGFLPVDTVELLYARHKNRFETLGYGKPISSLKPVDAIRNWEESK